MRHIAARRAKKAMPSTKLCPALKATEKSIHPFEGLAYAHEQEKGSKTLKEEHQKKSSKTGAQSLSEYLAGLEKFSDYGSSDVPTLAQLEKMEARLGARFPEILREIYLRYGGIGFGHAEISFDEIKERLSQF